MTAIRMPDLRARHEPPRAHAVRLPDLRVPERLREASRADGAVASTALGVVGAALAWWLPGGGFLHTTGLSLVVLGPLGLLATLTLLPAADVSELDNEPTGTAPAVPVPVEHTDRAAADVDERLPELELRRSVRP